MDTFYAVIVLILTLEVNFHQLKIELIKKPFPWLAESKTTKQKPPKAFLLGLIALHF